MTEYEKTLVSLAQEAVEELKAINISPAPNIVSIKENGRAKRRLGCCKQVRRKGQIFFEIEISTLLIGKEEKYIKEIILHELLHTCPGCYNHGVEWKRLARKVNTRYGYNIQSTIKNDDIQIKTPSLNPKYVIKCADCGQTAYRMRRSKIVADPRKYRCGRCGGRLVIYPVNKKESLELR